MGFLDGGKTDDIGASIFFLLDFSHSLNLISTYGETPVVTLFDQDNVTRTYRSLDGGRYEFVITRASVSGSLYFVVRMNA